MLEPDLAERYLNRLSVPAMSPREIDRVCHNLGVSHLLAFTRATIEALEGVGFQIVSSVDHKDFKELADLLLIPGTSLTLLASLRQAAIVSPNAAIWRGRNRLSWQAKAGVTYVVRYRYYPQFAAFQGTTPIPVIPYKPLDDIPLRFMSVQAQHNAVLELVFSRSVRWSPEVFQGAS
jgi:hypothetical protein